MKVAAILFSVMLSLTMSANVARAADADVLAQTELPPEIKGLISRILTEGCLDQHIVKQKEDGSSTNLSQRVGKGCDSSQNKVLDQHITKESGGKTLDLKQTITLPNPSSEQSETCYDFHLEKQGTKGSLSINQNICKNVLSATESEPSTTNTPTPMPEVTVTELPSTGPGAILATTLTGVVASLIGRRFFLS